MKMNDAAVQSLGVLTGLGITPPPGGLAPRLRQRASGGIVRRGEVLVWADSAGSMVGASDFDLTGWECNDSSFHVEDFVPVDVAIVDAAPVISEDDQRVLLLHGLAFALELSRAVYALEPPSRVRCILAANQTNATFRFHTIRAGESWNRPDLDGYRDEKVIVLDIEPAET